MQTHQMLLTISFFIICILFFAISDIAAVPLSYDSENDVPSVDKFVQLLRRTYDLQSKRGLDFGLHRGHSGMMTAKYLSGLEMAGPMGPGRKRRSDQLLNELKMNPYQSPYGRGIYFMNPNLYDTSNNDGLVDFDTIKRGLDLGFGRGFSGIQQARHLIGIEEANDAMGPGRRRRGASLATTEQQTASSDHNEDQSSNDLSLLSSVTETNFKNDA